MESKLNYLYYMTVDVDEPVELHKHDCFELVYYIRGSGVTQVDGIKYRYSPNSYCFLWPGTLHDQRHGAKTEVIFIGFELHGDRFKLESKVYGDDVDHSILTYLFEMKNELLEKSMYYQAKLDCLLLSILIEAGRHENDTSSKTVEFSYIKTFIREHCSQKIDKKVISELSGYSYDRFRQLFKLSTGLSPHRYIIEQRLKKAKKLLLNSAYTITTIASECGFYDHSQFCSIFKKYVGTTPAEYKNRQIVDFGYDTIKKPAVSPGSEHSS